MRCVEPVDPSQHRTSTRRNTAGNAHRASLPARSSHVAVLALQRAAGNTATVAALRNRAAAVRAEADERRASSDRASDLTRSASPSARSNAGQLLARAVHERKSGANGRPQQAVLQRMAACPSHLNDWDPTPAGWKPYFGNSAIFHCGFRGILENRAPTPGDPMNECFYDHAGTLVDDSHPYAGCKGTPDQYDASKDPIKHAVIDAGGIVRAGGPALAESVGHAILDPVSRWFGDLDRDIRRLYGAP
jgi:hypothetical protein